jgi:hypothetical protein
MSNQHKTKNLCPLCQKFDTELFHEDKFRSYFQCKKCCLIFVPTYQLLSPEEENARYNLHKNFPDDPNYRKFLSRIFNPIQKLIAPKSKGLDFGSGPGPTLSLMFEEAGHTMSIYDHFYANRPSVFKEHYNFITASEVVEHLFNPRKEFDRLWNCLKPGGYLGIMTQFAPDKKAFVSWHYKNDLTHVCFFTMGTCKWLAEQWQAKLAFADKDVVILQKKIAT